MKGILSGIRVVDLTRYIAGPYCGLLLANLGAEVIKVEKPGSGEISRTVGPYSPEGISLFYVTQNYNKKSVAADIRTPEGMEILKDLIRNSDVLIENFRAGLIEKMGLSYEEVKKINPEIIMVSISGFGRSGPWKDRLAFDGIISAASGVTRIETDHVERSKGALHDHMAGMYAAYGTLAALMEKQQTGKGQYVDVAMIASSSVIRSDAVADAFLNGDEAAMGAEDSAPYGYLQGTNGWIILYANTNEFYARMLDFIHDPFLEQEHLKNSIPERIKVFGELMAIIRNWAKDKTCEEMEEIFKAHDLPYAIAADPGRLLRTQHLKDIGSMVDLDIHGIDKKVPIIGFPIKMSNHPDHEYIAPPEVGEHTEEILKNVLGFTDEKMNELKEKGVL